MKKQSIIRFFLAMMIFSSSTLFAQKSSKTGSGEKLKVNLTESRVNWIGKKPTGEHNGYVKLQSGEIEVSKNEIKGGSFVIDMNSIVNMDLQDPDMNGKLVGHLKSVDFFDVKNHPTASFVITKISRLSGSTSGTSAKSTHRVEGNLTIKGITKKVGFDASINMLNKKLTATSQPFTINRTEWGVNYQSKSVFAELRDKFIYDDMTLSIDVLAE